jgi:hypothetical protein
MKLTFISAILAALVVGLPEPANAQPSTMSQPSTKSKAAASGGVEAIKPQEPPSKETADGNAWNGAYVGVNAGRGFGATTGANVVVPFGTSGKSEK